MSIEEIKKRKIQELNEVLKEKDVDRKLAIMYAMTIELIDLNYNLSNLSSIISDDLDDIKGIIRNH
jgi:hypothetical protein